MSGSNTVETSVNDPLLCVAPLPYTGRYYPLGFPLEIATNARQVLEAAGQSWGVYEQRFDTPPIRMHVITTEAGSGLPPDPRFRVQRHLTAIVGDQENFAICDWRNLFAFCMVTRTTVADPVFFRWHFLEAAVWMLHAQTYYSSLHAACIAWNGAGVLLWGDSGTGKSTLAYACARRGWTFITDDGSGLLWDSGRRVIGESHHFRFRAEAPELFPELRGLTVGHELERKPTIEVLTAGLPIRTAPECRAEAIVFLERQPGCQPRLVLTAKEEARERLLRAPIEGEEAQVHRIEAIDALLEAPVFDLRYGHYEEAMALLEQIVQGRLAE